jgi:SAM-dependent methyltransferase
MAGHFALHPGAIEHYEDVATYERLYAAREEDVAYFLRRCAPGSQVLEYGAGAGRLTIPLLKKGAFVTTVDLSPTMTGRLKERIAECSPDERRRAKVHCADMRTFRTEKRYDRVIAAFHTVCHLYSFEDIRAFLTRARTHLRPGGSLEFDLPLPRIDLSGYDAVAQVRVIEFDSPGGVQVLTQRWYTPQEIALHLHYAGFRQVQLRSDFSSQPIEAETSIFTVCATAP